MLAPIVLFTYNRLKNTKETICCLLNNPESHDSELIIFSDAPKNSDAIQSVQETRDFLYKIKGFKRIEIIERPINFGLAKNISEGVTSVVNKYGKVIVLEDDLSVSPFFLKYMNEGLNMFEGRLDIACIHGYVYPHKQKLPEAFLIKGADCWGWATWKRAWDVFTMDAQSLYNQIVSTKRKAEFTFNHSYPYLEMLQKQIDGSMNSWAICWYASTFIRNMYTIYPNKALAKLNSIESGGTHGGEPPKYIVNLKTSPLDWEKASLNEESLIGRQAFECFFLLPNYKRRNIILRFKDDIMIRLRKMLK